MLPTKLLLVEDDPQIVRALVPALQVSGHAVTVANDGSTALARFDEQRWDAVVLDLGLPDMDGKTVVRHVRESSRLPIIVISARHSPGEKVATLEAGADMFLNKPFRTPELIDCLRRVAREQEGPN